MRKVREVLRLHYAAGMSLRAVARSLKVSPAVPAKAGMGKCIRRAKVAGLSWPLPEGMDERTLEARLFPGAGVPAPAQRAIPEWAHVHTELRRKGVTLSLLWQEYKAEHPDGIQYSQFCERYRAFRSMAPCTGSSRASCGRIGDGMDSRSIGRGCDARRCITSRRE